jgi:hypothetical protein
MRILTSRSWLTWLVIAFGALLAILSAQDIDSVVETARWPTTPGTIVASNIASEAIGTYIGRYSSHLMYANRLHLTYVYNVAGQQYTGSRWNALPPSSNQASHAMLRKFPARRGVVVHYDPRDPEAAVIDTSLPIGKCIQLVCALLLMLGVWGATRPRRVARGHRPNRE